MCNAYNVRSSNVTLDLKVDNPYFRNQKSKSGALENDTNHNLKPVVPHSRTIPPFELRQNQRQRYAYNRAKNHCRGT